MDMFDKVFKKFDECMDLFEKGVDQVFKTRSLKKGTKIKIKKGSTVYIGQNLYVTLLNDVEATVKESSQ